MSESVFETVKIKWDGKEYEIPPDRMMGLIVRIEDHISFADLAGKNPPMSRIAGAWSEVLRYVGVSVSGEEVYRDMIKGASLAQIQTALFGLMEIMIPPDAVQKKTKAGPAAKTSGKKKRKKDR